MSNIYSQMAKWGFDASKMRFSLAVAFTAFIAMVVGWLGGLEHPQWAAITVFVTSQPTRGQLVEKATYRFIGTIFGAIFGALLVLVAQGDPWITIIGLSLWCAFCIGLGNLQKGYRWYGTVLAGYSAVIVAALDVVHPEFVFSIALDRVLTVFVGAAFGIAFGWFYTKAANEGEFDARLRRLLADILREAAASLRNPNNPNFQRHYALLSSAATLDEQLATMANGPLHSHKIIQTMQGVGLAATDVLMVCVGKYGHQKLADVFEEIAAHLHQGSSLEPISQKLDAAIAYAERRDLKSAVSQLRSIVKQLEKLRKRDVLSLEEKVVKNVVYDWQNAIHNAVRLGAAIFVVGAVWILLNLPFGQYALISTAIVISLASSGITPARTMKYVFIGQSLAVLAAFLCETSVWPLGDNSFEYVLMMLPFMLAYVLIASHRRTGLCASDYTISLMLLLSPTLANQMSVRDIALKDLSVLAGSICGYLAYRFIFHTKTKARIEALWRMVEHEIEELSKNRFGVDQHIAWRRGYTARVLKMVLWSKQDKQTRHSVRVLFEQVVSTYSVGELLFELKSLKKSPAIPPHLNRATDVAIGRLKTFSENPEKFFDALVTLEKRLTVNAASSEYEIKKYIGELRSLGVLTQHNVVEPYKT